jgi:glycosyltransferase involved in cell wall biosynthesis
MKRRLGYLSAAPRVSTLSEAELGGPRSHVLGIIHAFEALQWRVRPFIVGDRVPRSWVIKGSEQSLRQNRFKILLADLTRMGMGLANGRRAWREIGNEVDWVYERFAALQSLGGVFKKHGIFWILETNAPLFIESKEDRQTLLLSSLARKLEERAYKRCDVLVCVSEELKQIIVESIDVSPNKIVVMSNGVDTTFLDPRHYQAKRLFDGFTIGFVGTLVEWQGLDLLLEAVSHLRKVNDADINLVFVGDGPKRGDLEKKANELGLQAHSKFVGHVAREDVPALISGFDVGYSGQIALKMGRMYLSPLKLYEYMSMAKPVIAADYQDARHALEDGKTGFMFSSGDKQQLETAIMAAYMSQADLCSMGEKAREEAISQHSWEVRVKSLIDYIEHLDKPDSR